jgi:O-acetyl-ADP-ribose deacetylase (regulator of RNase III)
MTGIMPPPLLSAAVGPVSLDIVVADITTIRVDAIVNAANARLKRGGGVDGALHRAAGPELQAECDTLGGCVTGSAKITGAYRLPAKHVIHAVGPVWSGRAAEDDRLLDSCYRVALTLARNHKLASIAFPAISTGVYAFPPNRAARIAVGAVVDEMVVAPGSLTQVILCCFSAESAQHHADAFRERGLA